MGIMVRSNPLGSFLGSLLERPRQYLRPSGKRKIEKLCSDLLAEKTEVASLEIAAEILAQFSVMDDDGKAAFFRYINDELDVDPANIIAAAKAYTSSSSPGAYSKLAQATEPKRYEFLRRLNQPPGATAELVRMRADLISLMKKSPDLARMDTDFRLMLRAWFNRGFLVLDQVTWDSPASILEKIIAYEAVHEIETWDDLRRRLHPLDRRCFAFFHPAMPQEPLIFVEVALSKGVPSSIQDVLADRRDILDAEAADTAVFYSISNCQPGLSGISFGNSLIKQVVRDLSLELPNIKNFVTLSPIPGFRKWLEKQSMGNEEHDTANLKKLCAAYLISRNSKNLPIDPVARFHLQNGAQILAIHGDADVSDTGNRNSFGTMVNYSYDPKSISDNLRRLALGKPVAISPSVRALARQGGALLEKN